MNAVYSIPIVGTILKTIDDYAVKALFRQFGYLFCYKSHVEETSSEIRNIEFQEGTVLNRVEAARADGKTIRNQVTEWQEEARETRTRVQASLQRRPSCNCFGNCMFPNPVNRFRLGRKAAHQLPNLAKLKAYGVNILEAGDEISNPPANQNIPISDTTYQKFGSRQEAYQKLWEALVKEDGNPIIGIYGMAGVGKTRMMEVACTDSINDKVFDMVIRADVGAGDIDVINIQKQLAECLGCRLRSQDNMQLRATQLNDSITNIIKDKKTLVIFDDVWETIPLANIGIPLADGIPKGCKIILTSRSKYVCSDSGCTDIELKTLTDSEAWDMFKETVGTYTRINSFRDKSLARDVCNECGALPLLIRAVGNALKSVPEEHSWKHALFQLQDSNFQDIDRIDGKAYKCILLSFNLLKGPEKACLLLCSLSREDAEIEINMLADFAAVLQLLKPGQNVRGVVHNLKSASLLLEGKTHHTVKMHDIIRDVARSIALRDDEYSFLFISGRSHSGIDCGYSTVKLLQYVESDVNFECPTDMDCSNLHTLWLECNNKPQPFSDSFFRSISNLKIMLLKGLHIFPRQMVVQSFSRLTVLILYGCELKEMPPSIFSGNLEVLGICECLIPNPLDLTMLKSLRTLEVLNDDEIEMVPNSISSLSGTLEELHIPRGFRIFDSEGMRRVPISSELNKLTALKSLTIQLGDSESCPARNIVDNLLEFHIVVDYDEGFGIELTGGPRSTNIDSTYVCFRESCVEGGGEPLVERAEVVVFDRVEGLSNGLSSCHPQAYSDLKILRFSDCQEVQHIARIPHDDEIQQSQSLTSFSQLTTLFFFRCGGLNYLFCGSVAKCLVQLQSLRIVDCNNLEVVIRKESGNDGVIKFPKLSTLWLQEVESLTGFYGVNRGTASSSTMIMDNASTSTARSKDSLFDGTVEFPVLERLSIRHLNTSEIWERDCDINNSFCQLKCLIIEYCHEPKFGIPLAMLPLLQNLEELRMSKCDSVISEIECRSSSNESPLTLGALRSIQFHGMKALTRTRLNSRGTNLYPKLESLSILGCDSLRNVFLPSIARDLLHLEALKVAWSPMISEIIGKGEEEKNDEIVFPELVELELNGLRSFKGFCFRQPKVADISIPASHNAISSIRLIVKKLVFAVCKEPMQSQGSSSQHQSSSAPQVSFPKLKNFELDYGKIRRGYNITSL